MEVCADGGAVSNAVGNIKHEFSISGPRLTPELDLVFTDPSHHLFLWTFAIAAFFRVFGDDSLEGVNGTQLDYPPWRVRLYNAVTVASQWVRTRWNADLAVECDAAIRNGVIAAESAFETVTGSQAARSGLVYAIGGSAKKHLDEVVVPHWYKNLRPILNPFAFTDNLP